jgi:membrane protease YdiL (CAAX protease family)
MSTRKKKQLLWWVAILFSFFTFYCISGFLMVGSLSGAPGYSVKRAERHLTFYSLGTLVSILVTLVSLIAIWKLGNQNGEDD